MYWFCLTNDTILFHRVKSVVCEITLNMLMYCLIRTHHVNVAFSVLSQHEQLHIMSYIIVYVTLLLLNMVMVKYLVCNLRYIEEYI